MSNRNKVKRPPFKSRPRLPKTEAGIVAFRVGVTPQTVDADVQCGCGTIFRVPSIPVPDGELVPTVTGPWLPEVGGFMCPGCNRSHRVRATVVVTVEEEDRDAWLAGQRTAD